MVLRLYILPHLNIYINIYLMLVDRGRMRGGIRPLDWGPRKAGCSCVQTQRLLADLGFLNADAAHSH